MPEETEEVELEVKETEDESGTDTEESTEESEGEDGSDSGEDDTVTLTKEEHAKLLRESHAAKRLREKKSIQKDSEGSETLDQELVERTYLAAQLQILDGDIQDEALRLKEKLGFDSIAKAVNDPDIKLRLDNLIKDKKTKQSVAGGTGGSVQKGRGVNYYVSEYKRTGKLPDDKRIISQILDVLAQEET
jgi:hypothetical protein